MRRFLITMTVLGITAPGLSWAQPVESTHARGFVRARNSAETTIDLWDSTASQTSCEEAQHLVHTNELTEEVNRISEAAYEHLYAAKGRKWMEKNHPERPSPLPVKPADLSVCQDGLIGRLTVGTETEATEGTAPECGTTMTKVTVRSGKYDGKKGCIETNALTDTRPGPSPAP